MNDEPTFSLEELGEVKTVRVYNQAYVDKQQKRIETIERENAELKAQIEKMKCCMKCEHWYYYNSFCTKDNSYHPEGHSCEHFILRG